MPGFCIRDVFLSACGHLRQLVNVRRCVCLALISRLAHGAPIACVRTAEFPSGGCGQNQLIAVRADQRHVLSAADFPVDIVFELGTPRIHIISEDDLPVGLDVLFSVAKRFHGIFLLDRFSVPCYP